MADPKMLLAALAAIAAALLIIGFISLDWRFFAASALASLVIIAVGIKAGGLARSQSVSIKSAEHVRRWQSGYASPARRHTEGDVLAEIEFLAHIGSD